MKFTPFTGTCEVEPIGSESLIASDDKTFISAARVIQVGDDVNADGFKTESCEEDGFMRTRQIPRAIINVGDIVFFRPHGFFETPEYEGKKYCVLKIHPEFILGKLSND